MKKVLVTLCSSALVLGIGGCSTMDKSKSAAGDEAKRISELESQLDAEQRNLAAAEKEKASLEASVRNLRGQLATSEATGGGDQALLPPNAKPGECYSRVLIPATYRTSTKQVLKSAATERVEIVPATYGMVEEKVAVREESEVAKVIPAKYQWVEEKVLVKEPAEMVEVIPAKYDWVEEKVLVSEASEKMVTKPAVYKTVSEKLLVKPAYTTWKKGRGPIEKIDNATGEIMCLVEVPAEYKTVTKRIEMEPPRTEKMEIPAVYKTVKRKIMVEPPKTITKAIPAEYKTVKVRKVVEPPRTVKETIPAEYKMIKVRKMITPPQEKRIPVPAEYQTVTERELATESRLEWRPILCETNTTPGIIKDMQAALKSGGYYSGAVDGIIGKQTMQAVEAYQRDKGLARGAITIKTLQELGVN